MFEGLFLLIASVNIIKIVIITFLGFMVLIWVLLSHAYGGLWLQARLSGVPITFVELIGMTLRKTNAKTIVICGITAAKAGLELSWAQLEAHSLAGGNVSNVVRAMIALDRAGINPGWMTITADDLQGYDVLDEAQYAIEQMCENERNNQHVEQNECEE